MICWLIKSSLDRWDKFEDYTFPAPNLKDFADTKNRIKRSREENLYVLGSGGLSIFERI
jgi:hypothetical protein